MITWASSDVDKLLAVATKQADSLTKHHKQRACKLSTDTTKLVPSMKIATGLQCHVNIGRFVGTGGCNMKSLQKRTGTLMYHIQADRTWMVFYNDESSLASVKRAM